MTAPLSALFWRRRRYMKRVFYVFRAAVSIALRRTVRSILRGLGQEMKRLGRVLTAAGDDSTPRWTVELFHRCYLADAEFHIGLKVFRGPMVAVFCAGKTISFKMNWLAEKSGPLGNWAFPHGTGVINLKGYNAPRQIETGDIWFTFDNGYAILYLGKPRQNLAFEAPHRILRTFTYF